MKRMRVERAMKDGVKAGEWWHGCAVRQVSQVGDERGEWGEWGEWESEKKGLGG